MFESSSGSEAAVLKEDFERILSEKISWPDLAGSTVLVCGANGYIARYLIRFLLFLNEQKVGNPSKIIALVRNQEKSLPLFSAFLDRDDFQLLVQDICDPIRIEGPVDYIIHAASQSLPKNYGKDPAGSIRPNVIGTWNLLELARTSQCRGFLFLSSGEVYGKFDPAPDGEVHEGLFGALDPLETRACYSESKRMAETMCKAWHQQFGVPAKIARLGHTYGPGMDLNDGRVFADFTANIVRAENIVMKSDGGDRRLFCYLSDAVTGLMTVLLKGEAGNAYNVVNTGAETTIGSLAELLCGLFPELGLKVVREERVGGEPAGSWKAGIPINIDKMTALGWKPKIGLEEGFRRSIISYSIGPDL